MDLLINHIYLAKHLPVKIGMGLYSMFGTEKLDKEKEIQQIQVNEITSSCYLLSLVGSKTTFYVEKSDPDIVYLEDLGRVANINSNNKK